MRYCVLRIFKKATANTQKEGIMNDAYKTLAKVKKANKLTRLAFRKNGPKSFTRGQGKLLNALMEQDGLTQRDLVVILGVTRSELKAVVKRAERNGFVKLVDVEEPRTYTVFITELGREVAAKRIAANDKTAQAIVDILTPEEVAQLDAIAEKLIVGIKAMGINGKKKGYKSGECC